MWLSGWFLSIGYHQHNQACTGLAISQPATTLHGEDGGVFVGNNVYRKQQ